MSRCCRSGRLVREESWGGGRKWWGKRWWQRVRWLRGRQHQQKLSLASCASCASSASCASCASWASCASCRSDARDAPDVNSDFRDNVTRAFRPDAIPSLRPPPGAILTSISCIPGVWKTADPTLSDSDTV